MTTTQPRIIVIGAGYAGLLAAVRLAGRARKARITLVNASELFVERLRLHQQAANERIKQRSIPTILHGAGVNFRKGAVIGIDAMRHTVTVQTEATTQSLGYDYLVYTLGSAIERDSVPGVRDYGYTLTPAGSLSVSAIREKLPVVNAANGNVVVCGGGATGIETAAEFAKAYPNLHVRLVTRGEFGAFLGMRVAAYMRKSLTQLGVMIQDQTTVTEVRATDVVTEDGTALPCDLCLWAGGFSAPTLARDSGLAVNERGQLLIDPFMRSISHPEIYGAGDAAQPLEAPGVSMRMSAVTAVITGAHAADCLSAVLRGKSPQPLSFAYLGQGIALGHHNAIGFNNYPDDRPNLPHFTGRAGYEFREFFVRFLAVLPMLEKRLPGVFVWPGRGRYAAAKRRTQQSMRAEQAHALQQ